MGLRSYLGGELYSDDTQEDYKVKKLEENNRVRVRSTEANQRDQGSVLHAALDSVDIISFIDIKYIELDTCSVVLGFLAVQLH